MSNIIQVIEKGNDNFIGGPTPAEFWKPYLIDFIRESCAGVVDQWIIEGIVANAEKMILED